MNDPISQISDDGTKRRTMLPARSRISKLHHSALIFDMSFIYLLLVRICQVNTVMTNRLSLGHNNVIIVRFELMII